MVGFALPRVLGVEGIRGEDLGRENVTMTWEECAELALARVRAGGAEYGDIRIAASTTQRLQGEDRRIAGLQEIRDSGFGIRVLVQGAWGFAASSILSAEEIPRIVDLAVAIAKDSASLLRERVTLAEEPIHRATVTTRMGINPFQVSVEEKTQLLAGTMDILHQEPGIARSRAHLWCRRDEKLFCSTEGAHLWFDLMAVQGGFQATAVSEGRFASRGFQTPHLRAGYELIHDANFSSRAAGLARQAVEKVQAPAVEPGSYDMVLDPEHLSLTVHETCGHPSELDRALGYEANYAGTSFLTPDKRGRFRYGSPQVNLVADNTEEGALAATEYDDDGVACQRWDIVREGVFVDYCTNREVATKIGERRSRGSCRADGWGHMPMVRIANIGLEPGAASLDDLLADVKRGIYIEGHDSYSIDQRRLNFQFSGDACWLIEHGRRTHMLRDVVYHGITPEFWGRCDGVGDPSTRRRYGFITCGKGQPGQSGWMTHAASPARFRGVSVIRGGAGS